MSQPRVEGGTGPATYNGLRWEGVARRTEAQCLRCTVGWEVLTGRRQAGCARAGCDPVLAGLHCLSCGDTFHSELAAELSGLGTQKGPFKKVSRGPNRSNKVCALKVTLSAPLGVPGIFTQVICFHDKHTFNMVLIWFPSPWQIISHRFKGREDRHPLQLTV